VKKIILIVLTSIIFTSCLSPVEKEDSKALTLNLKKHITLSRSFHLVGCSLYDYKSQIIAKFPGGDCVFLKNGDIISSFQKDEGKMFYSSGLRYYTKSGAIKWEKMIDIHHDLNTLDDKIITALSSKAYVINGTQVRFDTVNVYNTEGENLVYLDTYELRNHIFKTFGKKLGVHYQKRKKFHEIFHANSAIVIPTKFNSLYTGEEKDLLVAVSFPRFSGIAIFSSLHKKIIWSYQSKQAIMTHHLNILKDGNLLFIVNDWLTNENKNNDYHFVKEENRLNYSSILEVTPYKNIKNRIDGKHDIKLYTKYRGGVSLTPNSTYLFTTEDGWVYEINPLTNTIQAVWSFVGTSDDGSIYRAYPIEQNLAKVFIENKNLNRLLQ
jgi:hypothetical protein